MHPLITLYLINSVYLGKQRFALESAWVVAGGGGIVYDLFLEFTILWLLLCKVQHFYVILLLQSVDVLKY